jgi:hypothetical protein
MGFVVAAFSAIAGAFAASSVGAFLTTTFVGRLLTSVAVSALSSAFAPKQNQLPSTIRTSVTAGGGVNPCSFILGRYATAGYSVCPEMSFRGRSRSKHGTLVYVIELGDVPGQELDLFYVDNELVALDPPDGDGWREATGRLDGHARLKYYNGTQTEADPYLLANFSDYPDRPWRTDMIGTDLCYAIIEFIFDVDLFRSQPKTRFVMSGIPLYDPRADSSAGGLGAQRWQDRATWAPSQNSAVQTYNILRGITLPGLGVWGGTALADDLPLLNWFTAMTECDVAVALDLGGTEPQFRTSFEVFVDDEPADLIEELLKGSAGQISEIGGTWKARIGGPALPVYLFSDEDVVISQAQSFDPFHGLERTYNGLHISYPDPDNLWQSTDAPPRYNADWEADDGARRLVADLALPTVPYANQVQRVGRAYIEEERRFRRHSLTLPPDAAVLEPMDSVAYTSARNGYDAKIFEVADITDDLTTGLQRVMLRERDTDDYAWSTAYELPAEPAPGVTIQPSEFTAPGVTLSSEVKILNQQPIGVLVIDVAWVGGAVASAQVQYRRSGALIWRDVGASSAGRYEVQGIDPGSYDVRVRPVNLRGVAGDWLQLLDRPIQLLGLPPQDVTGFDIAVVGATAHLSWWPVEDEALSHYILRWSPETVGASYSNAVTLVPKVPRPGTSVLVAAQTGTYFIRAVDKFANQSLNPALITTTIAAVEGLNAVLTVDEAPEFSGADVLFSKAPGLFAAAAGVFSAAGGTLNPTRAIEAGLVLTDYTAAGSGLYAFRDPVDLGAVFTSRLTARISVIRQDDTLGLFGQSSGLFAARSGLFTGNVNYADIEVAVEVSTSADMVSWGAWRRLSVGDFTARGFQFRALLTTQSANVTPLVTGLSVEIDMPDRTIAASDVVSGAGAKPITFAPAFKGLQGLGISAQGMASGDYYLITGKDAAGFTITFKTAAGADVSRTFDYVARGYGAVI